VIRLLQVIPDLSMEPIPRPSPNLFEYWMLPVFLVILCILAYVRVAYGKRLNRLYSSVIRIQILRQVMREELVFTHRASLLLFVNFVLVVSLLVYAVMAYWQWDFIEVQGLKRYVFISLAIASTYILKLLVASVLRLIFRDPGIIREYLYVAFLVNKAAGILLFPLVVGLIYFNIGGVDNLIFGVMVLLSILLLYRTIQGLVLCSGYTISWVYIILYLCTLEIMPFLIAMKILNREIV